jgi:hypothetical protein
VGHPLHFERAPATSGLLPTSEVSVRCRESTFRANNRLTQRSNRDLLDHFVGECEEFFWNAETEGFGGFEVED